MQAIWEAVRFEKVQPKGRTKPLLLECARTIGKSEQRVRFIVKALGLPEIHEASLCQELLGCRLARLFGMAAPMTDLVNISPEFLAATGADLQQGGVSPSAGLAVGVELIPNLHVFPASPRLTPEEVVEAARIYVFDMICQNADRRPESPNCGRADGRLVPFDFENAFSFRLAIFKSDPWRVRKLAFAGKHLFFECLQDHDSNVKWADVFDPFESVPARAVAEACGTIPAAWNASAADIHGHFEAVFAHWPEFKQEVLATLGVSS